MHKKDKPVAHKRKTPVPSLLALIQAAPKLPKHEWRLVFDDKRRQLLQTAHFQRWQLQEAKAKFSTVFEHAMKEGPQVVTRHNKEAVVILSAEEFRKLADGPQKPQPGMLETLLKCPKGPDLKLDRDLDDSILNLPPVFD
ncbi:MAG TPA: type II toxin-antitoxin system Phd/YefM family antitoxin [Phycisphaerae bacterium]|jgi:prevent-host-death family protein